MSLTREYIVAQSVHPRSSKDRMMKLFYSSYIGQIYEIPVYDKHLELSQSIENYLYIEMEELEEFGYFTKHTISESSLE